MSDLMTNIHGAKRLLSLRQYLSLAILIGAGIALSILAFIIAQNWERERVEFDFREMAGHHIAALEKEIARNMEVLRSIAALYDASRDVERQDFHKFVQGALTRHADIQAVEWIPRVKHSERAAYEEAARRDGFLGFQFTEREEQGQMVLASRREEYFPVYYVEPLVGNETAFGFDLGSNSTRLEALERSRDTRAPVATARIKLVQETEGQFGFLIFEPIYRRDAPLDTLEEHRQNLMGFALGVFRIGDLVEEYFDRLETETIDIHIYDNTAETDKRFLYSRMTSEEEKDVEAGLHLRALIDVADRQWSLLLHPMPKFFAAEKTFLPLAAMGGGLLFTSLIGIYLFSSLRHAAKLQTEILERKGVEERVVQRTQELAVANKELESFSYSVSHDLQAPLRGMAGFSHILLEDYANKLDEQGKHYLQRLRAGSQQMGQVIDDMLTLARVTRREFRRDTVNLSEITQTIVRDLRSREPDRQVDFVIAEGIVANGDKTLLRVLFENLLGNAWKFTNNHPRALIEFGVTQVDGKPAYFVKDDGVGFDMAYADKLFTPFQRLHGVTEFEGTGVGLATVQRIIHRHGGRLWAEGEVEGGATFYFTL